MTPSEGIPSPEAPVALVTGASQGIGAVIAETLAGAGAEVIVSSRSQASCEALVKRVEAAGGRARALALDVTDRSRIAEARDALAAHASGSPTWLVNNAGVAISAPLLPRAGKEDEHEELYHRHLRLNFHGARWMTEALVPAMRAHGRGRVVNVASSAALHGAPYVAAYSASKFALLGYTLCAAEELKESGVTFNAVCPHYVESPMLEASIARLVEKTGRTPEEARAFFAGQNPGGRIVQPEEVAEAVLALLRGDENGRVVELDGSAVSPARIE